MRLASAVKTMIAMAVIMVILVATVLGWCFFTAKGSNLSLGALQKRMTNLSYTYRSGNLAKGIVLDDLQWNLKNKTQIRANDIEVHWNPTCWRGKELCLTSATANEVKIILAHSKVKNNPIILPAVKLPFTLKTDSLLVKKLIIENGMPYPVVLRNIKFGGSISESTLIANSLQLDWQWIRAKTRGEMRMVENYPITLHGNINTIENSTKVPLKSDIQLSGNLLNMVIRSDISAPYAARVQGSLSLLTRELPADLNISWEKTSWPANSTDPKVFANDGDFNLSGNWPDYDLTGTAEISGADIPTTTAVMNGTVNTKRATFNPLHLKSLDGVVDATGTFKWRNGISWQAELYTDDLKPGVYWNGYDGNINGSVIMNGRTNNGLTELNLSEINTRGSLYGYPFSVTGSISKSAEGSYHLAGLEATSENNYLTVNGHIDDDSDLTLYFSLKSPQDFIDDLQGELYGNLAINGNISLPDISGTLSSASLTYGDTTLVNTKMEGILRAMGQDESEVKSVSEKITVKDNEFRDVVVSLNGSKADHFVRSRMTSQKLTIDALELSGGLDKLYNWTGKVKRAKGKIGSHPAWLDKPFSAAWINDDKTLALQTHCWAINLASACLQKSALIGKTGAVHFSLDGVNLETFDTLYPDNITTKGYLGSTGVLKWGPGYKPLFNLDTEVKDASLSIPGKQNQKDLVVDITNARFKTTTANNLISTEVNINTDNLGELNANIDIATNQNNYPLKGVIRVTESHIDWLASFIPNISQITGNLSAEARLDGLLASPEFDARLHIEDASVASPDLPLDLDDITIDLELNRKTAEMTGRAKSNGQDLELSGSGRITDQGWESDLNIKADRIAVDHDYLEDTIVSPDLNILMNPEGITIGGSVFVPRANIKIDQLGNAGLPLSNDVVIVDSTKTESDKDSSSQNISTQVHVTLGRDVNFQGFGLNADLRGDLTVKLAPQRTPELLGEILVDSGTYRSYGQNLIIRDGRINFVGPLEQAALSVEAFREVGNVIAGLRVDGSLQNPTTSLFSEPQLPQDEILSYVVLGRQVQFGSGERDDSRLLANAALFMGISNGRTLSKNVARNLGIEDFALTASGTGDDTQVMLSGRINNRLLVRYGVGVFNSVNTLFLRYDLADKLYLETTQGLEKAVDLFYSFEFD